MKLRNKKTGEIIDLDIANIKAQFGGISVIPKPFKLDGDEYVYHSLAGLNEEWEDYEEPKKYWFITDYGESEIDNDDGVDVDNHHKQIGNYFETKEEAEQAVEKLKAWKRLKDKGFRLDAVVDTFFCLDIYIKGESYEAIKDDLKIVFGGENESNN